MKLKKHDMSVIKLRGMPTNKELDWLSDNVGDQKTWLPHYISGVGWKIRKTNSISTPEGVYPQNYVTTWTLEFSDDKLASYYILKFQ